MNVHEVRTCRIFSRKFITLLPGTGSIRETLFVVQLYEIYVPGQTRHVLVRSSTECEAVYYTSTRVLSMTCCSLPGRRLAWYSARTVIDVVVNCCAVWCMILLDVHTYIPGTYFWMVVWWVQQYEYLSTECKPAVYCTSTRAQVVLVYSYTRYLLVYCGIIYALKLLVLVLVFAGALSCFFFGRACPTRGSSRAAASQPSGFLLLLFCRWHVDMACLHRPNLVYLVYDTASYSIHTYNPPPRRLTLRYSSGVPIFKTIQFKAIVEIRPDQVNRFVTRKKNYLELL